MTSLADRIAQAAEAVIAAIVALFAALFGGAREAGSILAQDARRIGRIARGVGETTARVVGTGLAGPARVLDGLASGIGSTLSAMLPRAPIGPRDVADAAVARDDSRDNPITPMPAKAQAAMAAVAMAGNQVIFAADALSRGDDIMAERYGAELPAHVKAWLDGLSPKQVALVAGGDSFHIAAHVEGRRPVAGLPLVPAAPAPITDRAEMQRALAEIRKIARAERIEAVERATGGGRPAALPTYDDDGYVPPRQAPQGPRPSFH